MAAISTKVSARTANAYTMAAASAGGDAFTNTGKEMLLITNAHATVTRNVTVVTTKTVDGLAVADLAIAIPALTSHLIGPFPTGLYNDANGLVTLTYDDEADLTMRVIKAGV
jgi:hypothetical protein